MVAWVFEDPILYVVMVGLVWFCTSVAMVIIVTMVGMAMMMLMLILGLHMVIVLAMLMAMVSDSGGCLVFIMSIPIIDATSSLFTHPQPFNGTRVRFDHLTCRFLHYFRLSL